MGRGLILFLMLMPAAVVRAEDVPPIEDTIRKHLTVRDGLAIYKSGEKIITMRAYQMPIQWTTFCGTAGLSVTVGPPDGEASSDIELYESELKPEQCFGLFTETDRAMRAITGAARSAGAKP